MFKIVGRILGISKNIKVSTLISRNISKSPKSPNIGRSPFTVIFSKKYLLTTNILSSGILMFVGDLAQQEIEYRQQILEKRYDYGRLSIFSF